MQASIPKALPGDTVTALISLVYPGVDYSPLTLGAAFSVFEGEEEVATGEVLNDK